MFFLFRGSTGIISPIILFLSIAVIFFSRQKQFSNLFISYFLYFLIYILFGLIPILYFKNFGSATIQTITDVLKSIVIITALYMGYQKAIILFGNRIIAFTAWLFICSVILSFIVDLLDIEIIQSRYRTISRMSGIFANPNELAAQSLYSLISIQFLLNNSKNKNLRKIVLILFAIVSFYVLFFSFSRSIFLAMFIVYLIKIILYSKYNLKQLIIFIVGLFLISILFQNLYFDSDISIQKRIDNTMTIFQEGLSDENTGGRIALTVHAMDIISEHPFTGIGIGNMQNMEGVGGVHNAYLAIWGNSGIIVFLYFIVFIFAFTRKLYLHSWNTTTRFIMFLILVIFINGITKTGVFEFKINNLIFSMGLAILSISPALHIKR